MYKIVELANEISDLIKSSDEFISVDYDVVKEKMQVTTTKDFFLNKKHVEIRRITDLESIFTHVLKTEIDGVEFISHVTQLEFEEWSKHQNKEAWEVE